MGVVNLFADTTYEGGSSIHGPFLATLGAGAALISLLAGLGEFLGYSLRAIFGWMADRTGRYWPMTFFGYAVNLLAVPSMALVKTFPAAAALVLAERIGRAVRKPTVESMLSNCFLSANPSSSSRSLNAPTGSEARARSSSSTGW